MKAPYKIALGVAVVLFLTVLVYFGTRTPGSPGSPTTDGPASDLARNAPKPAPSAGSPTASGFSGGGGVNTSSPGSSTSTGSTGADNDVTDVLARVRAQLDAAKAKPATETTSGAGSTPMSADETIEQPAAPQPLTVNLDGSTPLVLPSAPVAATPAQPLSQPVPVIQPGSTSAAATHSTPAGTLSPTLPTAATSTPTPTAVPNTRTGANGEKLYIIQSGDTLAGLAERFYGAERAWVDIAQANPNVDPARLRPGQEIRLPHPQELNRAQEPTPPAPGQATTYIIRSGDNLSRIANRFYGDPDLWRFLYNANRNRIGANPDRLQAGMRLDIPPKPDTTPR